MNYEHGLIVCTILKTIASNNSNHLGAVRLQDFVSGKPYFF